MLIEGQVYIVSPQNTAGVLVEVNGDQFSHVAACLA